MSVEFLSESFRDDWNYFVEISLQGSVFCLYEWLEFSTDNDFKILIYKENNNIIAGMPLPFFSTKKIRLPRLAQKMGVLYDDFSDLKYSKKLEKEKKIINAFLEVLKEYNLSYNMNFDWNFSNWLPFYWNNYEQSTRYTYLIDFSDKTLKDVWDDMDQNTRNIIKKAKKNNLIISQISDLKEFYEYNKMTFERQSMKIPYSYEYISDMFKMFEKNIFIFKALDGENNIHAMNFYIKDSKTVYYLMSGSDPKFRNSGAQNLIQWEAMNYFYDKIRYYDFEGSMAENIESNFRKFGTEQKQYFNIQSKSIIRKIKDIAKIILKR